MKSKLFISGLFSGLFLSLWIVGGPSGADLMPLAPEMHYDEMILSHSEEPCDDRSYGFRFKAIKKGHLATTGFVCQGIILNVPEQFLHETVNGKPITAKKQRFKNGKKDK